MLESRFKGIRIAGPPGSGKSALGKQLLEILRGKRYSIGEAFRQRWAALGKPEGEFYKWWPAKISREENLRANHMALDYVTGAIHSGQFVVVDNRYHFLYVKNNLPLLGVYVTAPLNIRTDRQLPGAGRKSNAWREKKCELRDRENDEIAVGDDLFGPFYNYTLYDYHLTLRSDRLTLEEEVAAVLGALNPQQAIAGARKIYK